MTIDLIVSETLERKLADVRVPRTDVADVRRVRRRRWRTRITSSLAAVVAAAGATTALLLGAGSEPERAAGPVAVPAMDFSAGLRGFYDAQSGLTHLGGQAFDLGAARDLETSASMTPYGLVFFSAGQAVRLLPADGRVRTLAGVPAQANAFAPTVKYDPGRGLVAWLTKAAGRVTLSVYEFGPGGSRLIGSYPVPCAGKECATLSVAGVDQGVVFVRGSQGTRSLDPAAGQQAGWVPVTDGWVTDVRNQVVLATGAGDIPLPPELANAGWRMVTAQSRSSLLTFDGAHELDGTTTLKPTAPGGVPIVLAVPPAPGETRVDLDSDGTVLVARTDGDFRAFWDCEPAGACTELALLGNQVGEPIFVGNDLV